MTKKKKYIYIYIYCNFIYLHMGMKLGLSPYEQSAEGNICIYERENVAGG
jgi:hypothetical protein